MLASTYTVDDGGDGKVLGHDPTILHTGVDPLDGSAGKVYYECSRHCGTYFTAVDAGTEYEPGEEAASEAAAESAGAPVPAPSFNNYEDGSIKDAEGNSYRYSRRGASLKLSTQSDPTIQAMRFSGSVMVPAHLATTIDPANLTKYNAHNYDEITDNSVIDFGFVYTQHQYALAADQPEGGYNPDPSKLDHWGSDNLYHMSVAANNEGKSALDTTSKTNSWTGVTAHQGEDGSKTLTFNLLLNIKQRNWKRIYIARTYIIYKYHGQIYTVFDGYKQGQYKPSDRAVWYVAAAVLDDYDEGEETPAEYAHMVNYLKTKIVNENVEIAIQNAGKGSDWYKFNNEYRLKPSKYD